VLLFDTSVPTSCEAEFGGDKNMMDRTATDPDMEPGELALDHTIPLEDLLPNTTYYVRARATDAAGNTERSETIMFTTLDTTDPTAGMTNVASIAEGTVVSALSSNWSNGDNDSSFGIHNALDGNMSTEWSTAGDGDDAWVELDLGQERTITHFAYRSRMMLDGTSIVQSVQLIHSGGIVIGPLDTPDHTVRYVFELDEPITVSTIRLEAVTTTGGNTGAKEIQLFSP